MMYGYSSPLKNSATPAARLQSLGYPRAHGWRAEYADRLARQDRGSLHKGKQGRDAIYYAHAPYFKREEFADEVEGVRIDHQGYFTDPEFQDETMRGIIVRLPHGRYLAGYMFSGNDERVYWPELHDTPRDAALMADEHARVASTHEVEYQERFHAFDALIQKRDALTQRAREMIQLRNAPAFPYARDEARHVIDQLRTIRAEIESPTNEEFR